MTVNTSGFPTFSLQFVDNETISTYFKIRDIQTKLIPGICGLGFVTNLLSLLVFLQPSLRRLSCSIYLSAKAVSDFLFLLTVFIIWLSRVDVGAFHTAGICQMVVFFSYLTAFTSIWLTVTLTVENLLCVLKPWYVHRSCNAHSAVIITAVITVLGIIVYHFCLWNSGVVTASYIENPASSGKNSMILGRHRFNTTLHNVTARDNEIYDVTETIEENGVVNKSVTLYKTLGLMNQTLYTEKKCVQLEEFSHFIVAIAYIDSFITLFVPLVILIFTNGAIVILAVRAGRRRSRLELQKRQYQLPGTHLSNSRMTSVSLEAQASRFLFAISMTTLLFHFPSHANRLKTMLFSLSAMDLLFQRVFETIYYLQYATGFFVYLIFGANFRKVLIFLLIRQS